MQLRFVRLRVADLRRSEAFWRGALGVGPEQDGYTVTALDGAYEATSAHFQVGPLRLALHRADGAASPGDTTLSFEVEDLEAAVARLVALGARVAGPLTDMGEIRDQILLDPDGYRIQLHAWR